MSNEVEDAADTYPGVDSFTRMFIQTVRVSVGDLKNIEYNNWVDNSNPQKDDKFSKFQFIAYISWGFWLLNIYLIQIVMLNLLIAQVGQIYDKVMSLRKSSIYKEKAELNMKTYQQLYFFGFKHEFIALIMQTPLENQDSFNFDDFTTFSERVKKSTQETANKLENRLNEKVASLDKKIETKISSIENKVSSLDKQIEIKISSIENKVISLDSKIEIKIDTLEKSIANILEIQKQILKNQEIEIKSDCVSHTGMINNSQEQE